MPSIHWYGCILSESFTAPINVIHIQIIAIPLTWLFCVSISISILFFGGATFNDNKWIVEWKFIASNWSKQFGRTRVKSAPKMWINCVYFANEMLFMQCTTEVPHFGEFIRSDIQQQSFAKTFHLSWNSSQIFIRFILYSGGYIIRFTLMPLKIHWNIHEKQKMVSYKISKNRKNIIYIHILLTRSKGFQRQLYHRTHWRKNTNKLWAWYGFQYEGINMMLKKGWISTQTHVLTMSMWASTFEAPILNSHGFDILFYTEIQEHHERTLNPFIIRLSNVSTENAIEWFPWRSWKKTWNQFFYFAKPNERVHFIYLLVSIPKTVQRSWIKLKSIGRIVSQIASIMSNLELI